MESIQGVLTEFLEQVKGTAKSGDDDEALPKAGSRKYFFLKSLWELKAFDKSSLVTTEKAVENLKRTKGDANAFKTVVTSLRKEGLIETERNRGGGCYLSQKGHDFCSCRFGNGT